MFSVCCVIFQKPVDETSKIVKDDGIFQSLARGKCDLALPGFN